LLFAIPVLLCSGSVESGDMPGVLQYAGSLSCEAGLAQEPRVADTMLLDCKLKLTDDLDEIAYEGKLIGADLWRAYVGPVRVAWDVFAPTKSLQADTLKGDFDIASKQDFKIAGTRENILYGGVNGKVALRLIAPRSATLSPATRLTLRIDR
jgi:hypothetical protein